MSLGGRYDECFTFLPLKCLKRTLNVQNSQCTVSPPRMHEMRPIAIDDPVAWCVCQSVYLSVMWLRFAKRLNGFRFCLRPNTTLDAGPRCVLQCGEGKSC